MLPPPVMDNGDDADNAPVVMVFCLLLNVFQSVDVNMPDTVDEAFESADCLLLNMFQSVDVNIPDTVDEAFESADCLLLNMFQSVALKNPDTLDVACLT
jgi:hypothetical protein